MRSIQTVLDETRNLQHRAIDTSGKPERTESTREAVLFFGSEFATTKNHAQTADFRLSAGVSAALKFAALPGRL